VNLKKLATKSDVGFKKLDDDKVNNNMQTKSNLEDRIL